MTNDEKTEAAFKMLRDFIVRMDVQLQIINHKLAELQKKEQPADVTVA